MPDERMQRMLDLPKIAGLVFMGFGALMVVGGIILVFDDPGGFALIAFGLVFGGAGYLARRLFAVPEGKKAVLVEEQQTAARRSDGRPGSYRQATIIHVDEDASEAEVDAAREAWQRAQWERRPDWVSGHIAAEEAGSGGIFFLGASLWGFFALAAAAAGFFWDEFLWLVAAGFAVAAGAFLTGGLLNRARRRKFGESLLTLDETPALLGGELRGKVTCGIDPRDAPREGFRLELRCLHRWEETSSVGSGSDQRKSTIRRREVLWESEDQRAGQASSEIGRLAIPLRFDLPADQPATSFGSRNSGIAWELVLSAAAKGLDYKATFHLPVLAPGSLQDR